MATNFPETGLDSLTNPTSTDTMASFSHLAQHANANDAIEALQAKVGVDGSAVTTSHDYKLSNVTGNDKAASVTGTETLTNKTLEDGTALESSAAPTTDAQIANKKYVDDQVATANELSELTDVTITGTPADNEFLAYDSGSGEWINQTKSEVGMAIGSDVQAWDTHLDSLAGLTPGIEGKMITSNGLGGYQISSTADVRGYLNVEDGADVTDTDNVTLAGALMDSELTSITDVKALDQSVVSGASPTFSNANFTEATDKNYVTDAEKTVIGNTSGTNTGDQTLTETSKSLTVESPTDSEDISMFFVSEAVTITKMACVLTGSSTPSVTWTVRHSTDRSATGNEVVTSGTTTTSLTTGSVVTSFNDATIPANSFVWLETTAQSGTVDSLNLTIIYGAD